MCQQSEHLDSGSRLYSCYDIDSHHETEGTILYFKRFKLFMPDTFKFLSCCLWFFSVISSKSSDHPTFTKNHEAWKFFEGKDTSNCYCFYA